MARKHAPTYNFVKGKVVLTCRCGFVRRYDNDPAARRAYFSHERGERRKVERKAERGKET